MRYYIRYYKDGAYVLHTSYSKKEHYAAMRAFQRLGLIDHRTHIWSE